MSYIFTKEILKMSLCHKNNHVMKVIKQQMKSHLFKIKADLKGCIDLKLIQAPAGKLQSLMTKLKDLFNVNLNN